MKVYGGLWDWSSEGSRCGIWAEEDFSPDATSYYILGAQVLVLVITPPTTPTTILTGKMVA